MIKVVVLGVTGMLGHKVAEVLQENRSELNVIGTSRSYYDRDRFGWGWRYLEVEYLSGMRGSVTDAISGADWVINCIGVIKPRIDEEDQRSVARAITVNSLFPYVLSQVACVMGIKVIQIATDCVFRGNGKLYTENSPHDATDIYGKTKSLGEVSAPGFVNLRCSIIGTELGRSSSLLEWVLHQPINSQISGYQNHLWNGVTTRAFAKICEGVILEDRSNIGTQHIVPSGTVTKYELLKMICSRYGREDIEVVTVDAPLRVDRTLSTKSQPMNFSLWNNGGYSSPPTIEKMLEES